jgi:putative FmdB family regulatory protein
MPIYEYECEKCGKVKEAFQNFSEKPLSACEHCSGKLHKIISQSTFHLKGTGWYVTDYSGKNQKPTSLQKDESGPSAPDSAGSSKTESKSVKDEV